jgi:hypothetical protein
MTDIRKIKGKLYLNPLMTLIVDRERIVECVAELPDLLQQQWAIESIAVAISLQNHEFIFQNVTYTQLKQTDMIVQTDILKKQRSL